MFKELSQHEMSILHRTIDRARLACNEMINTHTQDDPRRESWYGMYRENFDLEQQIIAEGF